MFSPAFLGAAVSSALEDMNILERGQSVFLISEVNLGREKTVAIANAPVDLLKSAILMYDNKSDQFTQTNGAGYITPTFIDDSNILFERETNGGQDVTFHYHIVEFPKAVSVTHYAGQVGSNKVFPVAITPVDAVANNVDIYLTTKSPATYDADKRILYSFVTSSNVTTVTMNSTVGGGNNTRFNFFVVETPK